MKGGKHERFMAIFAPLLPLAIGVYQAIHPFKTEGTYDVTQKFQKLLDREGIRSDLEIKMDSFSSPEAKGTNFGFGNAQILIPCGLENWVIRHEIAHIKHNDRLMIPLAATVAAAATAALTTRLRPSIGPLAGFTLSSIVGLFAMALFSRYREREADDFATKHSSPEDVRNAIWFFTKIAETKQAQRNTSWLARWLYSPEGGVRYDFLHPSFSSRIQRLESAQKPKS
jgi:hypothetical protein